MKSFGKLLVSFLSYFLMAFLGLKFATINDTASPVWPASGIAMVLIYTWRTQAWLGIFLAATLANFFVGHLPLLESTIIGLGTLTEGILATWIFIHIKLPSTIIDESLNKSIQVVASSLIAPLASAVTGTFCLFFFNHIEQDIIIENFTTWWTGDMLGILLIFWTYISWANKQSSNKKISFLYSSLPMALLQVGLAIYLSFHLHACQLNYVFVLLAIISPLLMDIRTSTLIQNILVTILVGHTANGHAIMPGETVNASFINLQVLIFVSVFMQIFIFQIKQYLNKWIVSLVPISFMLLSMSISFLLDIKNDHEINLKMTRAFEKISEYIGETLRDYARDLELGRRVVVSSKGMGHEQLLKFIQEIKIEQQYPGVTGLGIIDVIQGKDMEKYRQEQKKYYGDSYQFKMAPDADLPIYMEGNELNYVVSMIEPIQKNGSAAGLVMSSEGLRKEAITKAIEQHKTILSEPVIHIDSGDLISLIFTPVLENENQKQLPRVVYSPLQYSTFFNSIMSKAIIKKHYHDFDIAISVLNKNGIFQPVYGQTKEENVQTVLNLLGVKLLVSISESIDSADKWMGSESLNLTISSVFAVLCLLILGSYGQMMMRANTLAQELIKENEANRLQMFHTSKLSLIGQMASGIAHEINNPLAILIGKNDQLKHYLQKINLQDEKITNHVNIIEQMALRIGKIVKSVKSLSRDGKNDPIRPVHLSKILEDSLELVRESANQKQIKIEVPTFIPNISLLCRDVQIEQVMVNLLGNSIDAIVNLEEKWVKINFLRKGNIFKIIVQDSGHGISRELQDKIMNPFFTTKEPGKGTGLGLSLSKVIMQEHKGDLTYDSSYPNTTFILTFTQFTT